MDPIRQTVRFPWGTVSYLEWNPPPGEAFGTLLLLHGGGLDNALLSWGEVGPALADAGYRVIAPDHPGYGKSPPSAWKPSQERMVRYVGEFVDAMQLRRYSIGGISLGAGLAIGHVLQRPEHVSGAILLSSYGVMEYQFAGPLARPTHFLSWLALRTGVTRVLTKMVAKSRWLTEASLRQIIRNPANLTPELVDDVAAAARNEGTFAAFEYWQQDQLLWNRLKTNYTDQLSTISCPTLVIHGNKDSAVPVVFAIKAARLIPNSRLVIVGNAGHWVQRDRPDVVIPTILDFLNGLA